MSKQWDETNLLSNCIEVKLLDLQSLSSSNMFYFTLLNAPGTKIRRNGINCKWMYKFVVNEFKKKIEMFFYYTLFCSKPIWFDVKVFRYYVHIKPIYESFPIQKNCLKNVASLLGFHRICYSNIGYKKHLNGGIITRRSYSVIF